MKSNNIAVILTKDKSAHTVVSDEKLLWADGVGYNVSDRYMHVSAAQVHLVQHLIMVRA